MKKRLINWFRVSAHVRAYHQIGGGGIYCLCKEGWDFVEKPNGYRADASKIEYFAPPRDPLPTCPPAAPSEGGQNG